MPGAEGQHPAQRHQAAQEETPLLCHPVLQCLAAFIPWETALGQSGLNAQHYKIGWIKFVPYLGLLGEPHTERKPPD